MVQPWTFLHSRIIRSYRFFQMKNERYRSPRRGQEHEFYLIDSLDWVNVIPQTADGEVILGLNSIVSEPRDSPWRFLEECSTMGKPQQERSAASFPKKPGLGRDEPILLGTVHPNPAFHTNRCHTDLVKNATHKNSTKQDSTDDIEVLSFPLSEIPRLIHDGKTSHALVVAAFYWSFSIAGFKNRQPASEEVREKFGINLFLHTSRRIWGER